MNSNAIIGLLLICALSFTQKIISQEPSAEQTLSRLKKAVNERGLGPVENYLAPEYEYAGMKSPMSLNILEQVINQFPKIDSIVVYNSTLKDGNRHLEVKLYTVENITDKTIILDSNYKILQADIADIAVQGHGSNRPIENTDENPLKLSGNIKIPFWLTKTGHIVVAAEINGVKGNFIVDSGTPGNLLVNYRFQSYTVQETGNSPLGVSGKIKNAGEVIIDSFKCLHIELNDVNAMTSDLEHLARNMGIDSFAGTIGYGILKNYIIEFDYKSQQLVLWQDSDAIKAKYGVAPQQVVPLTMAFHIPVLEAKIGGELLKLGLDSGAQGNMLERVWEEQLTSNYSSLGKERLGGAENNYVEVNKVRMKDLWIKENRYEMDFVFGSLFGGDHEVTLLNGLLGYPFLSYQKTAINFMDNELYFLN